MHGHRGVPEINMAEYGSSCKQSVILDDKSDGKSQESIPWRSWSTVSIFRHTFFHDEKATMTSETSENTIVAWFYFTLCYQMLTWSTGPNWDVVWFNKELKCKEKSLLFKIIFLIAKLLAQMRKMRYASL